MKEKKITITLLTLLLIFLNGCMTITINQEVKSDATANIEMIINISEMIEIAKSIGNNMIDLDNINICANITSQMELEKEDMKITNCTETNGVVTIKGTGNVKKYLEKDKKFFYTKYTYKLNNNNFSNDIKNSLLQKETKELTNKLKMTYNLKMPGTIQKTNFGQLENNILKINLLETQKLNNVTSKQWNTKNITICLIILILLIGLTYIIYSKKIKTK